VSTLSIGRDGTVYFDEPTENAVHAIAAGGILRRIAGTGAVGTAAARPGAVATLGLGRIQGGAVDTAANVLFLDALVHTTIVGVNLTTGQAFLAVGCAPRDRYRAVAHISRDLRHPYAAVG
jgi:hypothetical protein